ncbi:hypothetical protein [Lonepinella koalarum]|uniref:Uncharacterized protein n=1 Tax=Lonepinella koalarum TaxID=53417 RepID=A0A4R1L007_9PAST|nr:hypothetical protein [Lonepinella koalarum]MDH2927054.1 hypothetical protein [Lonepinella koalarum]TCK70287.1 hypothetical protein EV692_0548 [Lonepinella koalarum]TFJ89322.1 hypothetical protein E0709_09655 [Lonepinella koalarum]
MGLLKSLKKKCGENPNFPKAGIFLVDELSFIFNHFDENEVINILKNNELSEYLIKTIEQLQNYELVRVAKAEIIKNPIYNTIFFELDGTPIISKIRKYFFETVPLPNLSNIFVLLTTKIKHIEKFRNLKGYQLAGIISFYYLQSALKIITHGYVRTLTGKALNSLKKQIERNSIKSMELCLQSSEAIILSKQILFEHKEKSIIETAKYLLSKEREKIKIIKEEFEAEKLEIANNAIKENSKKALEARNKPILENKRKFLKAFDEYKEQQISKGLKVSKDHFAEENAQKYGVKVKTARKNWLQGY